MVNEKLTGAWQACSCRDMHSRLQAPYIVAWKACLQSANGERPATQRKRHRPVANHDPFAAQGSDAFALRRLSLIINGFAIYSESTETGNVPGHQKALQRGLFRVDMGR
jgi:hypothetical protein